MRWLIVEDALRDRKGHWFEYVTTMSDGLKEAGDDVTILADRKAEPFVLESLNARPVLPESIWHRMGDDKSRFARYARVPVHAVATWRAMSHYLRKNGSADIIFVPTVTVHHLLGWTLLLRRLRRTPTSRLLLFFANLPIRIDPVSGRPNWVPSPTTRLLSSLLTRMAPAIRAGQVILGTETAGMQAALAALSRLPVSYLPHPVPRRSVQSATQEQASGDILMACYGPARSEKGSDFLQVAIRQYLKDFPDSRARFAIQWVEDFQNKNGQKIVKDPDLVSNPKVQYITRYFNKDEYPYWLGRTSAMLLPYQLSSYRLRVSRVALEGMTMGIPLVVTGGSSFASQMESFGAGVCSGDGDVASLSSAIRQMELEYSQLRNKAMARQSAAQEEFSVARFRSGVLAHTGFNA